jgi:hypothetical protein
MNSQFHGFDAKASPFVDHLTGGGDRGAMPEAFQGLGPFDAVMEHIGRSHKIKTHCREGY